MKGIPRFRPAKRTSPEGKTYWVIWDALEHRYSSFLCHGVYSRKRDAKFAIDFYEQQGLYVNQL